MVSANNYHSFRLITPGKRNDLVPEKYYTLWSAQGKMSVPLCTKDEVKQLFLENNIIQQKKIKSKHACLSVLPTPLSGNFFAGDKHLLKILSKFS